MRYCSILLVALASGPGVTAARSAEPQPALPAPSALAQEAEHRFPQPVRVGDLVGRKLLAPQENQPVLGRVIDVIRTESGLKLVVEVFRWPNVEIGGRAVAVPAEAVALLGEYVALVGLKPDQLGALPDFDPTSAPRVTADESVSMGLVKPFH